MGFWSWTDSPLWQLDSRTSTRKSIETASNLRSQVALSITSSPQRRRERKEVILFDLYRDTDKPRPAIGPGLTSLIKSLFHISKIALSFKPSALSFSVYHPLFQSSTIPVFLLSPLRALGAL
jgi:hypothetical protein